MRVRVRGHREVALAHVLSDPRPRHAAQMQERNPAEGLRKIVDDLVDAGEKNLIVMGDLNEGPDGQGNPSQNFAPLYAPDSPLVDVFSLAGFDPGPKPGTFQSCSRTNRIDYIFVSKNLAPKVVDGGVERHGLWGAPTNTNPPSA
jgi:endonuclease/exonuclease/phosphatase family metal-dependent hydrolase